MASILKDLRRVLASILLDNVMATWVVPEKLGQIVDLPVHKHPHIVLLGSALSHNVVHFQLLSVDLAERRFFLCHLNYLEKINFFIRINLIILI